MVRMPSLHHHGSGEQWSDRKRDDRRQLASALLLSLLIHVLLLTLNFGAGGLGLPGLRWPWQERRVGVPELSVVIVPSTTPAEEQATAPVVEPLEASSEQIA